MYQKTTGLDGGGDLNDKQSNSVSEEVKKKENTEEQQTKAKEGLQLQIQIQKYNRRGGGGNINEKQGNRISGEVIFFLKQKTIAAKKGLQIQICIYTNTKKSNLPSQRFFPEMQIQIL